MNNSDKLYQKLDEIRSEIKGKGKGADCVFKTYKGDKYKASTNRLMIVGKATAGWDRSDSRDFVLKEVSSGNYHSHFWHFVKKLSYDLNKIDSEQADATKKAMERVVWSNLMRIGVSGGNPYGENYEAQKDACVKLLRLEINCLKPTHLVFTTGNDYWKAVLEVTGSKSPCKLAPDIWPLEDHSLDFDCRVFWTRHPQGWEAERKQFAFDTICSR